MSCRAVALQFARLAIWWGLLFAGWWVLVAEWSTGDLLWGAVVALLAAATGMFVSSAGMVRREGLAAAVKVAPSVAVAVILDFGIVVGVLATALLSGHRDAMGVFRQRAECGRNARSAGGRSLLTLASTVSPNAYVIELDGESGDALLHELRPRRFSERPV